MILKNRNTSERSSKIKKQLISTGVYIALAVAVVGITSNSVKNILIGNDGYDIPDSASVHEIQLPELDKDMLAQLPKQTEHDFPEAADPVSETPEGVNAQVSETAPEDSAVSGEPEVYEQETPEPTPLAESKLPPSVRVNPSSGYISREFSDSELIYTPTMNDFRTHSGIDITGDIGSPVIAFASGTVADIYNDPFMGVTVVIEHSGGMVSSYSNLSEQLPQDIAIGASVEVGQTIGGIGETAIIESAEVPHVHFELYLNETCVNPEDYIS